MNTYAVYKNPSFVEKQKGIIFGGCIADGTDRLNTIRSAAEYCRNNADDYDQEEDAILVTYDESSGQEVIEDITLDFWG